MNFAFFVKDNTIIVNNGKISKKIKINLLNIINLRNRKRAKNGTRTHNT